jgi:XTP/dITP diphosphohydrolase
VPVIGWGRVNGTITTEARGDEGFGYDPIFQPDEGQGATFAEMTLAEKQAISHRGRALVDVQSLLGLR